MSSAGDSVTWMVAEFILLFVVLPVLFAFVKVPGGPIPVLLLLTVAVAFYLRRARDFDRRDLWRPEALCPALRWLFARRYQQTRSLQGQGRPRELPEALQDSSARRMRGSATAIDRAPNASR